MMLAFLKRLLWPLRPRNHSEFQRFVEHMDRAKAYGLEEQRQSALNRRSRSSGDVLNINATLFNGRSRGGDT